MQKSSTPPLPGVPQQSSVGQLPNLPQLGGQPQGPDKNALIAQLLAGIGGGGFAGLNPLIGIMAREKMGSMGNPPQTPTPKPQFGYSNPGSTPPIYQRPTAPGG